MGIDRRAYCRDELFEVLAFEVGPLIEEGDGRSIPGAGDEAACIKSRLGMGLVRDMGEYLEEDFWRKQSTRGVTHSGLASGRGTVTKRVAGLTRIP